MANIDIFNGDADGICALTQLRLAEPRDSRLVTGVKRDIALVGKAGIRGGDVVTILDISLEKNCDALLEALAQGARCLYFDHHFPGDIPRHEGLEAVIDTSADTCTSILVNAYLGGALVEWAVVGAFGDNLLASAQALARPLGLAQSQVDALARLGLLINYNGYGASLDDLHFDPEQLYRRVSAHRSPFDFMAEDGATFGALDGGYEEDVARARGLAPELADDRVAVLRLPDAPWARRVSGVFSNELSNAFPGRAHAVVTEKANGNYLVSVRAPSRNKAGADEVCRQFVTGGGRKGAAGINDLPADEFPRFVEVFRRHYTGR